MFTLHSKTLFAHNFAHNRSTSETSWIADQEKVVRDLGPVPRGGFVLPEDRSPGGHAAVASEALLEESAWSLLAMISTVRRLLPSVACHWRLWSRTQPIHWVNLVSLDTSEVVY